MAHLLCEYFDSGEVYGGRAQILGLFRQKLLFLMKKNHFNCVKSQENQKGLDFKLSPGQNDTLICGYFHSGQGHLFWTSKICVFDIKTYFNYVKSRENHISLKFKMSARQNSTFDFRKFLFTARSVE